MRLALTEISRPPLLRLLQWWELARGDRDMPSRADLDPADLIDILPFIVLLDVAIADDGTPQFTFRLAGGHVEDSIRLSLRGKRVRDLPLWGNDKRAVYEQYLETFKEGRPTYHVQEYDTQDDWHVRYDCLLAPMSRHRGLDALIGGAYFQHSHRTISGFVR